VKEIKLRRVLLYILLFGTMLMFGLVENIRGVSLPLIRDEFDVPFERQGLMVSMLSFAFVVSNIIAGIFLGRFGIKPSILAGFSSICLGVVLVFFMPGFFSITLALFTVFAGFGFLDIGMNALASRAFVTKAALLMNLLHSFYGIGAIIGPQVAGFVVKNTEFDWRSVYLFSLPLVLLTFALAIFARIPGSERLSGNERFSRSRGFPKGGTQAGMENGNTGNKTEHKSFFDALRTPMVWMLAITLGIALVIEANTPNWGPLYFQDVYGLDPATEGAAFLSTFFVLFTLSRLICGPFVERIGYVRSLLGVAVLTLVVFAVGFSMGARGIFVLPILGFLVGLFWPTMMAVAIVSFGRDAPVYASAMIAIAGLVNTVVQFMVGLTNRFIGPAWGYRSTLVYTVLLIFVLLLLYRNLKRRKIGKI